MKAQRRYFHVEVCPEDEVLWDVLDVLHINYTHNNVSIIYYLNDWIGYDWHSFHNMKYSKTVSFIWKFKKKMSNSFLNQELSVLAINKSTAPIIYVLLLNIEHIKDYNFDFCNDLDDSLMVASLSPLMNAHFKYANNNNNTTTKTKEMISGICWQ